MKCTPKTRFRFQLWWHHNWSNIFFPRIINSYWSLRRCHVHLSTCHSRDTGATNLWRRHLAFLLSHINMKQTWLKTCGFRLLLRWRAIKISVWKAFHCDSQVSMSHRQGSGLRGHAKFSETCRCCLRREYWGISSLAEWIVHIFSRVHD